MVSRAVPTSIALAEGLQKKIDDTVESSSVHVSRSELIREAIRFYFMFYEGGLKEMIRNVIREEMCLLRSVGAIKNETS